jgi:hypothetical protein
MFTFPEKMLKVFKEDKIQMEFERDGYVILPFYDKEEVRALTKLYHELHPKNEEGFFPSTFSKDKTYRQKADCAIQEACDRSAKIYLENIKMVCGAYIVKNPSPESGMCVHQDMSLLDESRFTGVNIWATLTDLSVDNGTLFVLKGSHRLFPTYRGSSIPEFFQDVNDELIDYLEPVIIEAGQAVFFDQSIIHFSPPNYSKEIRIVTNTYFTHKDAEYRTYFYDKEKHPNKVEAFAQSNTFMTDFEQFGNNIQDRPTVGESLGLIDYNFPRINPQFLADNFTKTNARELIEKVSPTIAKQEKDISNTPATKSKENILSKLKNWFAS